jgi:hypothetical protein
MDILTKRHAASAIIFDRNLVILTPLRCFLLIWSLLVTIAFVQKCCKGSKILLLTPGSLCELVSNQSMFPQYPLIFLYCRGPLKRALNRSMRNQFDKIPSCRATASIGRVRGIRGGLSLLAGLSSSSVAKGYAVVESVFERLHHD